VFIESQSSFDLPSVLLHHFDAFLVPLRVSVVAIKCAFGWWED